MSSLKSVPYSSNSTACAGSTCRRNSIQLLLLAALALFSVALQAQQPALKAISKLLPADAAFVYATDTSGVAGSIDSLLAVAVVKSALDDAEQTLGFTLKGDVLPWIGRLGFSVVEAKAGSPGVLLLAEIRDQAAFNKSLPLLQTKLEQLSGMKFRKINLTNPAWPLQTNLEKASDTKWTATSYAGVDLRYATIDDGSSVAWGQFGGWLVVSHGEGAIRKAIDAWKGTAPALSDNGDWAKAVAGMPDTMCCLFNLNGDALAKMLDTALGDTVVNTTMLRGLSVLGSMTENDDYADIELSGTSVSAAQRKQLFALKASLTPVSGKTTEQLPRGAFAELLTSNPGEWADALEQLLTSFAADADDKQSIKEDFSPIRPLWPLLHACSGALGVSANWTREKGCGLTAVGDTGNIMQAKLQVLQASAFFNTLNPDTPTPLEVKDEVVSLPKEAELTDETLHMKPSWMAKDGWFKFATAPEWMNGAGVMIIPPAALGADCALIADLGFVSALREQLEARMLLQGILGHEEEGDEQDIPHTGIIVIEALHLLGLDHLKLLAHVRIAVDGSCWHGAAELQNANSMLPLFRLAPIVAATFIPTNITKPANALQTRSLFNLHQLAMASLMYCQDNNENLPPLKTPADIKRQLNVPDKLCLQPSSKLPYLPNPNVAGKSLGAFDPDKQDTIILFYEQTPYADGSRGVAFLDGHVEMVTAERWAAMKTKAGIK